MAERQRDARDLADEWHERDRQGVPGGSNPGPSWHIKDTGDFNDDGRSDILWQNDNGTPAIWLMDGMNPIAQAAGGQSGADAAHVERTAKRTATPHHGAAAKRCAGGWQ